jgi:transcriptional regulator with XRE-family HTH domain
MKKSLTATDRIMLSQNEQDTLHYQKHKKSIGQRITTLRKSLGLNVVQLSKLIELTPQAVSQWISGDNEPNGKNLIKLSRALKSTPQYIQFGYTIKAEYNNMFHTMLQTDEFKTATKSALEQSIYMASDAGWSPMSDSQHLTSLVDITIVNLRRQLRDITSS